MKRPTVISKNRPHVAVRLGDLGQRGRDIQLSDGRSSREQPGCGRRDLGQQLPEKLPFQFQDALLGIEHQRLVFLQIRRDVTLGVDQRLLADVVGRDERRVGGRDLDVVAEDLVVAHLERPDAGARPFHRLQIGDPTLGVTRRQVDAVELGREAGPDDPGVRQCRRRLVGDGGGEEGGDVGAGIEA